MDDDLSEARPPVFLEPWDEYWEIHNPGHVSVDEQREYRLAPLGTAGQLKNAFYCGDCFPHASSGDVE